ncbi:MAG: drug/metabolite transporter (DMT)-like permease [Sulfurimonas sp.]|jgi:drug/metabolite transporter (DMT)-like permease
MLNLKTYFLVTLCVLFWSGNFIIGRFIKDDVTPLELSFFRWFFVFLMMSPILIIRHKNIFKSLKQNFKILTILSVLGITSFNTILYFGLSATTSTNALIINSTIPILVLLMSYFILKQKMGLYQTIGILLSTFGVIFLILKADLSNIFSLDFNHGDILIVVSSIVWALYSVLVKFKPKDLNDVEFFVTISALGFVFLVPVYLYQGYSIQHELEILKDNYLFFLYISIFASITSFYFWHYGIEKIGASKTSQFAHLMPIFGITLASIFLKETLEFYHLMGAIFIAFGIYLSLFYKKQI